MIEVNMNMLSLLPSFGRERTPARFEGDAFLNLHREINRLFDETFRGFGLPALGGYGDTWPSVDVHETDKGLEITAELPGVDEKDVDVTLANGTLTIRGEKRHDREEKDKSGWHVSERSYGSFARSIPLPFEVDDKDVKASFDKGVLHVTLPKSPQAESKVKKIAVKSGT
jgi:HSP20 family protein